jgi:pimeloyl-ACP methyl ester carboxylesterase
MLDGNARCIFQVGLRVYCGMRSKRYVIRWTEVDRRRVRYRIVLPEQNGAPRTSLPVPVLFIHGLGCSSDAWSRTLQRFVRLRANQPVIAVDLPGYGRSAKPEEAYGIVELADWLARFLDAVEIDMVDVGGNSMGCQVALALASRYPERVRRSVLIGPTSGDEIESVGRYVAGLIADSTREPVIYNLCLIHMYAQMGVGRYLQTAKKMLEDDALEHARNAYAPTLVLRGRGDAIVSRRAAQKLVATLPNGTYAEMEHSAHAVMFSRPKAFTHLFLSFVISGAQSAMAGRSAA